MRRYLVGKMLRSGLEGAAWALGAAGTSNAKPPAFPGQLVLIGACVNVCVKKSGAMVGSQPQGCAFVVQGVL
jgi:hypothetical protein